MKMLTSESYLTKLEKHRAKLKAFVLILTSVAMAALSTTANAADKTSASTPTDAQIAMIVVVADTVDVDYGKLAVKQTSNQAVKEFTETMVRDHTAVNDKAIALAKKLGVTPEASDTSKSLKSDGKKELAKLKALTGAEFDKAYVDMKTTEVRGEDQITESDEHLTSPAVATGNPASNQLLTLIAQQPFFKGLSGPHLQLLADSAMETQFKAGQWIFRQGDPASRFYLILEGKALVESEAKERGAVPIRTLGPGDDLAWAWLFPPYYMHFSACATEPTRAIFFYGTRLRQQCEANHELGYQLMKRIAEVVVQNLNATQQRLLE